MYLKQVRLQVRYHLVLFNSQDSEEEITTVAVTTHHEKTRVAFFRIQELGHVLIFQAFILHTVDNHMLMSL